MAIDEAVGVDVLINVWASPVDGNTTDDQWVKDFLTYIAGYRGIFKRNGEFVRRNKVQFGYLSLQSSTIFNETWHIIEAGTRAIHPFVFHQFLTEITTRLCERTRIGINEIAKFSFSPTPQVAIGFFPFQTFDKIFAVGYKG